MPKEENKKEHFTVSSLAKYVGLGDRKTWRKIVANERYKKEFQVNEANKTTVYIKTLLSKLQLIGLYNDYLQVYIKSKKQVFIMQNVNIPKKSRSKKGKQEKI